MGPSYTVNDEKTASYQQEHLLVGDASWYGAKFHGKRAASGEYYNMYEKTAAHKTLPFGLWVRVTNLNNGLSVDLKINDRGPYIEGRIIDLSKRSFREISPLEEGVIPVKIEILDDAHLFRYKH